MTWVIGRAGPFGYAVGLSDIRVTLQDGTEENCLQKIYDIGPNLALGFAGSVIIGFAIVEQLKATINIKESNTELDPLVVANRVPNIVQEIFNSFPLKIREDKCHLMLLSAHPTENDGAAPWARCYIHKFLSPDFKPSVAPLREIVSIGSGSSIDPYIQALRGLETNLDLFRLETGTMPGSAYALVYSITSMLRRTPIAGISNHLHICIVERDGVQIGKNNEIVHDHPEDNFTMPPVAQSWEELQEILGSKRITKSIIERAKC